ELGADRAAVVASRPGRGGRVGLLLQPRLRLGADAPHRVEVGFQEPQPAEGVERLGIELRPVLEQGGRAVFAGGRGHGPSRIARGGPSRSRAGARSAAGMGYSTGGSEVGASTTRGA